MKLKIINTWFWKLIMGLATISLIIILLNSIFFPGIRRDLLLPFNALLISSIVLIVLILLFIVIQYLKTHRKSRKYIYLFVIFLQLFLQLYLSSRLQGAQGVDDFDMRLQIANFIAGNQGWAWYFSWAPQNAGTAWVLAKIVSVLGTNQNSTFILNLINFGFVDVAFLSGWLTLKNLKQDRTAQDLYFVIGNLFSPIWLTALVVYTDVISLTSCMVGVYLLSLIQLQHKKWLKIIVLLLGLAFVFLSYVFKMNAIILTIAVLITVIFALNVSCVKKVKLFIGIMVTLCIFGIAFSSIKKYEHVPQSIMPFTYWLAVSYNNQTDGTVRKGNISTIENVGSTPTKEGRNKYLKKLLKQEINSYTLKDFIVQFLKKINVQWSLGTMGIEHRNYSILRCTNFPYDYIFGSKQIYIRVWSQIIYIIVLVGALTSTIFRFFNGSRENTTIYDLLVLFFLGIFLFHTFFWEVQERYAYIVSVPLLIMGVLGIQDLYNFVLKTDNHGKLKKIKMPLFMGLFGLIILGGMTSNKFQKLGNANPQVVMGQDFVRKGQFKLQSHQKITEKLIVRNSFNSWQLGYLSDHPENLKITVNGENVFNLVNKNFSPGVYQLTVENISNRPNNIYVLKVPYFDLLQKPVDNYSEMFIGISAIKNNSQLMIKPMDWFVIVILLELVTLIEWGIINKMLGDF